jgi:hypothetical protein
MKHSINFELKLVNYSVFPKKLNTQMFIVFFKRYIEGIKKEEMGAFSNNF